MGRILLPHSLRPSGVALEDGALTMRRYLNPTRRVAEGTLVSLLPLHGVAAASSPG